MQQRAIPVVVLSGFLGSGKTTLLIRLLQHAKSSGLRASVLMNEIGAVDVDGTQVSSESGNELMERITEGCLCCSKKSELALCLERLVLMQPDLIVIELTGVANPEEIVEAMTEPTIMGKVVLHRIVTVLDAEHVLDYNSIFSSDRELIRTLRRQIEVADIIVGNKFDLISNRTADKVKALVRDRNGSALFIQSVRCEIDGGHVLDGITASGERRQPVISGRQPASAGGRMAAETVRTINSQQSGLAAASSLRGGSAAASSQPNSAASASSQRSSSAAASHASASHAPAQHVAAPSSFSRIRTAVIYPGAEVESISRRQFEAFVGGRGNVCLRAKGYMPYGKHGSPMLFQLSGKRLEWSPASYDGAPYFVMIGIDLDEAGIRAEWARLLTKHI